MHISDSLGLSSRLWDYFDALLTNGILRRKVQRRVEYLEMDDRLIREYPHGERVMVEEELRMSCVERGIDVIGKSEESLRKELGAWLKSAKKVPIERLLLTRLVYVCPERFVEERELIDGRPSVWPIQPVKTKKE